MKLSRIGSLATNSLMDSGWVNGKIEFSNWVLYTYFYIENGKPMASFKVLDGNFSKNPPLFETDSYQELEKWVEEHKDEIQKQIQDKINKRK